MKKLEVGELDKNLQSKLSVQCYGSKPTIDEVKIVEVRKFSGEDGTFEDLVRVNDEGNLEIFPEFKLRQINRSRLLSGAVKAWHLHLNQEDIWYVLPENHMILGLWDLRDGSRTKGQKMRVVMGGGSSKLVYIPRGVAHGVVNVAKRPGTIFYFVNQQFSPKDPDEQRLKWDEAGADFWKAEKG